MIALMVLLSFGMSTKEVSAYVSQGCFGPIGQNYSTQMYYPTQQYNRPTYRPSFTPNYSNNTYVRRDNATYQARPYVGGENSTLIGALLGGVGGYVLGRNSKNRNWIAAGGALLGGVIGKQIDRSDDVMPGYYANTSYERRYYSSDRSSGKFDTGFSSGRVRAVPYGGSSGAMAL
jgi:hypothetical protein